MVVPATAQELNTLLENFDANSGKDLNQIAGIAARYPYFQLAAALTAKALQEQESFEANTALNKAAIITANRALLRKLFSKDTPLLQKDLPEKIAPKIKKTAAKKKRVTVEEVQKQTIQDRQSKSFTSWIREMQQNPKKQENTTSKWDLIDQFIASNPSIGPLDKNAVPTSAPEIDNEVTAGTLMTETLAKLFVQQEKYEEALKAYGILRLKYPEKNSFFADQINAIKRLKRQKE